MGEHKEEDDATISYNREPSAVAVCDHVANGGAEKSPSVDSVDSEVQGDVASADGEKISDVESVNREVEVHGQGECRVEGSSTENVRREDGGSMDGKDIAVGAVDTDINVNAICDSGEESEGKLSHETATCAGSVDASSGRDLRSLHVEDAVVDDSASRAMSEAGVHALDLGIDREDGVSSRFAESEGGEVRDGGQSVFEQNNAQEVAATDAGPKSVRIGNEVHGSSVVEGSSGGEIQVEEVSVSEKEESLDKGGLVKEGIERGETSVAEDVDSRKVGLSEKGGKDKKAEDEVGDPLHDVDYSIGRSDSAVDSAELAEVALKEAKQAGGSRGDSIQYSETQKIGVTHSELPNRETDTDTTLMTASSILEDSSVAATVLNGETVVIAGSENVHTKAEASSSGAVERKPAADALEGIVATSGRDSVSTEKDGTPQIASNSLEEQAQVAGEGRLTCPNIEGMDTDAFHENFCFSVEELQATYETTNGSTENGYYAFADPAKLVGGEVATTENKMLLCSSKNENLILEECLHQSTVHDSSEILTNEDSGVGGKKQLICAKQASLQKENQMTDAECQQKVEAVSASAEKSNLCLDLTNSSQAIIEDVVSQMESKIPSDPNSVTTSSTAATDPFGNNRPLNFEDSLDKSKAGDSIQVGSIAEQQHMRVQEPACHTDLQGEARDTIAEQTLEMETFSRGSVDTKVMDAGETAEAVNGKGSDQDEACKLVEIDENIGHQVTDDRHVDAKQVYLHEVHEMDNEDQDTDDCGQKTSELEALHPELSRGIVHQARYELPSEAESAFFVSDLVWGKVRSHPWWPGQIFDPCDASEQAMKYQKKDCFLVAYFGDKTFAWNEASLLKPFRSHFSQALKQGSSEAFQNAVNSALEEVSRRVELGLACSCTPSDIYSKIKCQTVENAGIREESSTREAVDKSIGADLFDPYKLVEYVKELANYPDGGADRLELAILKSQVTSFNRHKGYSELPEVQFFEGLENTDGVHLEEEATEHASFTHEDNRQILSTQEFAQTQSSYNKRKHNLNDGIYPRNKERSMSDLMGESWDSVNDESFSDGKGDGELVSPSSGKKQKVFHPFVADDLSTPEGSKTISLAKVSASTSCSSKPSFKIGDCISRVASLMTGSPSILKGNNHKLDGNNHGLVGDGSDASFLHSEDAEINRMVAPSEYSSLDELICQLHLAAQDPSKGYSFLNTIICFFSDFRNSVIVDQHDKVGGKRKKISNSFGGFAEAFEFDDMNDTYWTDRVIQNGSEEQPSRKNRKKDNLFVPIILDKPPGRPNSRKRYSEGNYNVSASKPVGYVDENAPAELVMHFPVADSVPSETKLNKMFKHFGPINESETEVDRDTNRARVVFKKCSDAEAAYGSAPKFNIFGSMLVNYQLNYTISVPFKTPPSDISQFEEDATLFLEY